MSRTVTYFRVMDKPDYERTAKIKAIKIKKYVDDTDNLSYKGSYHDVGFLYEGFTALLKDAECNCFDTVYVMSLSEWGLFNWTERIEKLDRLGVTVIFKNDNMTSKDILALRRRRLCRE